MKNLNFYNKILLSKLRYKNINIKTNMILDIISIQKFQKFHFKIKKPCSNFIFKINNFKNTKIY